MWSIKESITNAITQVESMVIYNLSSLKKIWSKAKVLRYITIYINTAEVPIIPKNL